MAFTLVPTLVFNIDLSFILNNMRFIITLLLNSSAFYNFHCCWTLLPFLSIFRTFHFSNPCFYQNSHLSRRNLILVVRYCIVFIILISSVIVILCGILSKLFFETLLFSHSQISDLVLLVTAWCAPICYYARFHHQDRHRTFKRV